MKKGMGFSSLPQPLPKDKVSGKKKYGQSNAMLQMDDFLSLARVPPVEVKKPTESVKVEKKSIPEVTTEVDQGQATASAAVVEPENENDPENTNDGGAEENEKKKRDRNAPLKPRPPKENLKKKERAEKAKKKAEEQKLEAERLAKEAEEKLKIVPEPVVKKPEPAPVKKDPRLNEIVQEYLSMAPVNCKYRSRNSELMNIVHDLVSLDRTVHEFVPGCGKEDKKFLKTEELLTRCLLKFDNIERNNEVLTNTRKLLIKFTQTLLEKLEQKAVDTTTEPKPEPVKATKEKMKETKAESEKVNESVKESTPSVAAAAVVDVNDVEVIENENAGLSVEEILKKKGKKKKPTKK